MTKKAFITIVMMASSISSAYSYETIRVTGELAKEVLQATFDSGIEMELKGFSWGHGFPTTITCIETQETIDMTANEIDLTDDFDFDLLFYGGLYKTKCFIPKQRAFMDSEVQLKNSGTLLKALKKLNYTKSFNRNSENILYTVLDLDCSIRKKDHIITCQYGKN